MKAPSMVRTGLIVRNCTYAKLLHLIEFPITVSFIFKMIRTDVDLDENSEIPVPETFSINGCDDSTAFFNMDFGKQTNNLQSPQMRDIGGFNMPFASKQRDNVIKTPNPPPAPTQATNCNGNCQSCAFSFLCKSAAKKLTSLGGFVPKLG